MMGSLSGASWSSVVYVFVIFILCVIAIIFFTGHLDILMLGDDAATTLGLNLRFIKMTRCHFTSHSTSCQGCSACYSVLRHLFTFLLLIFMLA